MTPPAKIAHYKITTLLGEGGMGAVYRAIDTKLHREVAIKILTDAFTGDADRLARFTREAQVLASLNHPNIGVIYGVEEQALILELIEGPTLADRVAQGAMPIEEALPVASQIAAALEYAHEKGVIHRDLKPANVKITPDGTVKVLDFGLAKIAEDRVPSGDVANSPTLTMRATQAGVIMGTVSYMSPEQARGRPVDKRSDIWAFGAVLYEMLCGQRLIDEDNVSDGLAAVLKSEITLEALPAETPVRVRRLIERCLERDPKQRLRDIGEARIALDAKPDPEAAPVVAQAAPARAERSTLVFWVGAAVVAVAAAAGGWLFARTSVAAPAVARLSITLPVPLSDAGIGRRQNIAMSPDGKTLAFVGILDGKDILFVRAIDQLESKPLSGTDGAYGPVFSPDSAWIAFVSDGKLKKVRVLGGTPSVVEANVDGNAFDWTENDAIVYSRSSSQAVERVPASGGASQVLVQPNPGKNEIQTLWPSMLPGATDLLFVINPGSIADFSEGRVAVETIGKRESREILATGSFPHYIPTGHLVFFNGNGLLAAPFDLKRRKLTGAAVPVADGLSMWPFSGAVRAAISTSGTLVYAPGRYVENKERLVALDASGGAKPLTEFGSQRISEIALSPDGQRVAMRARKANDDIHLLDIGRGLVSRFTYENGDELVPLWSPDGKRLVYSSEYGGPSTMFMKALDGNGAPEKVLSAQYRQLARSFSPDGKILAYDELHSTSRSDIWTVRLDQGPERKPEVFLRTPFAESRPAFSPDGKWMAYQSDESGRMEVYVARFPGAGMKQQISAEGGVQPLWAPSGKQLFFLNGQRVMAADVETGSALRVAKPRMLFENAAVRMDTAFWGRAYAVFPDGKRFLFVERAVPPEVRELVVVLNWFEEVKRKAK